MTPMPKKMPLNCWTRTTSPSSTCSSSTRGWASAAPQTSISERRELAAYICQELTIHAQIEEEVFYPAMRKAVPGAAALLDEAQDEHKKVTELIARIQGLDRAGSQMDNLVAQLARLVEHHVKEERDELFPKARSGKALDLADLGRAVARTAAGVAEVQSDATGIVQGAGGGAVYAAPASPLHVSPRAPRCVGAWPPPASGW